jgi:hypothetical protein
MFESAHRRGPSSKHPKEHLFRAARERASQNNFGTIVRALWPDKPALNLAQRLGCSERAAQFYIDGDRKISAQAARVIFNELFE